MTKINGISINELPFLNLHLVGELLFEEFPVTTLYSDKSGTPIVKEWIDCDDTHDRFFYFQTTKENLKKFINGNLSQRDFIENTADNFTFISDEKDGKSVDIKIVSSTRIPQEYLPETDNFFKKRTAYKLRKLSIILV